MKLVGIDGGLTKPNPCGIAVISDDPICLHAAYVITPTGKDWSDRIDSLVIRLYTDLKNIKPDGVVYELPHFQKNNQVLLKLAHVGGAVRAVCRLLDIPVVGVQPIQAKRAWTGNANASKQDMIDRVNVVFGVNVVKDAADACGIAWWGMGYFSQKHIEESYGNIHRNHP